VTVGLIACGGGDTTTVIKEGGTTVKEVRTVTETVQAAPVEPESAEVGDPLCPNTYGGDVIREPGDSDASLHAAAPIVSADRGDAAHAGPERPTSRSPCPPCGCSLPTAGPRAAQRERPLPILASQRASSENQRRLVADHMLD
jgi:hypothetical protein